jgi:hypothetical protein
MLANFKGLEHNLYRNLSAEIDFFSHNVLYFHLIIFKKKYKSYSKVNILSLLISPVFRVSINVVSSRICIFFQTIVSTQNIKFLIITYILFCVNYYLWVSCCNLEFPKAGVRLQKVVLSLQKSWYVIGYS